MSQSRLSWSYALLVPVFAVLSLGSSSKSGGGSASTASSASTTSGDAKSATLIGSCDRSDTFHFDCTEAYEPSINNDDKSECDTLGGKFRIGQCPRINAISQCFQGDPPYLSGSYAYAGTKTGKASASDCPRGYKDWSKSPELKPNTQPASCNSIHGAGTCSQYSAVTADLEKSCIDGGGTIKQPPEPCPTASGLDALKLALPDGTTETDYYYTTSYKGALGSTQSWKQEDVNFICGVAGSHCTHVAFAAGAVSASQTAAAAPAKAAVPAKLKRGATH